MITIRTPSRVVFVAALGLLLASAAVAGEDARLIGSWVGVDEDNEGERIEIRKGGVAVIDGDQVRWSNPRPGVIRYTYFGETIDARYTIAGDRLTLSADGESYAYRRIGKPPAPERPDTPPPPERPESPPRNPLGGPEAKTADPFARRFEGEDIALDLDGSAAEGYRGSLRFGTGVFPVRARSEGTRLTGIFTSKGADFEFTATLDGDTLTLRSAGRSFTLKGEKPAPENPLARAPEPAPERARNPLGGGLGVGGLGVGGLGVSALKDVYTGKASRWQHPKGWFSFDMPEGWSVWQQTEDGLLINPGFAQNDTLDAIIMVNHGELGPEERNRSAADLLAKGEPELRQALGAQGIQLGAAKGKPRPVTLKDGPGVVQTWDGKSGNDKGLTIWLGAVVRREYHLSVTAILVKGKEEEFLPRVRRVFQSMAPKPPQRNRALEQALVGRGFFMNSTNESGSFSVTYDFKDGGRVLKTMMFSGGPAGGSSEEWGTFEVIGEQIYLHFKDGQDSGDVVTQGGRITSLEFGSRVYRAR